MQTHSQSTAPLFDVVVYEVATSKVESIVGSKLRRNGGRPNAEFRLDTILGRLNERFTAAIVPTGRYSTGATVALRDRS
jgi:hypothetical protein